MFSHAGQCSENDKYGKEFMMALKYNNKLFR